MLNTYKAAKPLAEADYHLKTTSEEYDVHFQYPVKALQRSYMDTEAASSHDAVRLEPLIVCPTRIYRAKH